MHVIQLGSMDYRSAWQRQEQEHARVLEGGPEAIILVEHTPVITVGRRPEPGKNLIAAPDQLAKLGVQFVESDRGGDITYHGPGQLVAYPIIRLQDHRLSVGKYVQALLQSVVATLASFGIQGTIEKDAIGVWVRDGDSQAKICALGVRIRRGVSMHGIALNVTTDLNAFNLIVPCGLVGRPVTSMKKLLGDKCPPMQQVQDEIVAQIKKELTPLP